jgi:hypothetical protein
MKVTCTNYNTDNSQEIKTLTFDISNNKLCFIKYNGEIGSVRHTYSDEIKKLFRDTRFISEKPYGNVLRDNVYEFEDKETNLHQKGYIYGLKKHNELIDLLHKELKKELDLIQRTQENLE